MKSKTKRWVGAFLIFLPILVGLIYGWVMFGAAKALIPFSVTVFTVGCFLFGLNLFIDSTE